MQFEITPFQLGMFRIHYVHPIYKTQLIKHGQIIRLNLGLEFKMECCHASPEPRGILKAAILCGLVEETQQPSNPRHFSFPPEEEDLTSSTELDHLKDGIGTGSRRHRRQEAPKVVAMVGLPGAGKSILANKLLNHPTWDAFEEGDGTFGATIETQRAEWDDMVVIDTPGIPSHDAKTTMANFDAIVDALRKEGSLSTLIFLVQQEDVPPAEIRDYAILLRQLNQLPCSKLIVCRQVAPSRRHKRTEEDRRWVCSNDSCLTSQCSSASG